LPNGIHKPPTATRCNNMPSLQFESPISTIAALRVRRISDNQARKRKLIHATIPYNRYSRPMNVWKSPRRRCYFSGEDIYMDWYNWSISMQCHTAWIIPLLSQLASWQFCDPVEVRMHELWLHARIQLDAIDRDLESRSYDLDTIENYLTPYGAELTMEQKCRILGVVPPTSSKRTCGPNARAHRHIVARQSTNGR